MKCSFIVQSIKSKYITQTKSHPNIYKLVDLFKTEQVATEVTLRQLKAGGVLAPKGRRTELKRKG